ncbi:hypothetical protein [Leptospira stimsonii]|uniref:Uncharacterized protein n=1 Tax=Leptospira stimsonii TaxID=2202203 RepID=A0A396YNC9_9LEPT|nr:hypothetical protein [Leptospira stimsonii]RHX83633.1 hypothetical protein DLM75_23810 [Leptospira stimsonii]
MKIFINFKLIALFLLINGCFLIPNRTFEKTCNRNADKINLLLLLCQSECLTEQRLSIEEQLVIFQINEEQRKEKCNPD